MGDEIEGAMQQAAQWGRHVMGGGTLIFFEGFVLL